MDSLMSEYEDLKVIYREIIEGYSYDDDKKIYLKHLTELETTSLVRTRQRLFVKFKNEGILTEEERLKQALATGEWSKENEDQILEYRIFIADNEKVIKGVIPQQHGPILRIIEDAKSKLASLLLERRLILGSTANDFAERESMYELIRLSLYKDKELTKRAFEDGLDELEVAEIEPYMESLDRNVKRFSEVSVKRISVPPFFLNPFSYCKDNVYTF